MMNWQGRVCLLAAALVITAPASHVLGVERTLVPGQPLSRQLLRFGEESAWYDFLLGSVLCPCNRSPVTDPDLQV